ncbi:Sen15 protein-domain-containing protein [Polychytrium aggregatum]|uniref:Sen15 protein-domain-containing protein n=1 Tax=Polychytrium aggregatum TaxID=110093 RepID=UPI0022FE5592|nr:Sen15 protein-domain-containing protein [Polychytrium aggregatum]KAI9207474.1 Sen15 protein-domain-containing protein [Polychytrium aggregatum]
MEAHPCFAQIRPQLEGASEALQELVFQVYIDLLLAKQWRQVSVHRTGYSDHPIVLTGKGRNSRAQADQGDHLVVPVFASTQWSIDSTTKLLQHLETCQLGPVAKNSMILGIHAPDSTVVYYEIHNDLVPPPMG